MASADRARNRGSAPEVDALLGELRDDAGASAAVLLRFGQHNSDIVLTDVRVLGDAEHWPMMQDGIGPDGFDHDCSDEALSMREGQWCLEAPARRHFNSFCWLDEDIAQLAPWQRSDACRSLYEPNSFTEQYRAVLVDHGEVTGWVSLLWRQAPRRRGLVETKAAEHLDELRRLAREMHAQPRRSHRLLLDANASTLAHDTELRETFGADGLRQLRLRCRPTHASAKDVRFFDGYSLNRVAMRGENGERATLVLVNPLAPVRIDMRKALTSLQRRVANLVAEGNSNKEAAGLLDVSVNTVKYHLKNIYPLVGVTNRVELASFLSGTH